MRTTWSVTEFDSSGGHRTMVGKSQLLVNNSLKMPFSGGMKGGGAHLCNKELGLRK